MRVFRQAAAGLALLVLGAGPASAITLELLPAFSTAENGNVVSIDLVVSGLNAGGAPSLGAFDIDVLYDPSVLSVAGLPGYTLGGGLGDLGLLEAEDYSFGDDGFGTMNLSEVSYLENDAFTCVFCIPPYLDDIQPASFVLATIDFSVDALAEGATTTVAFGSVYVAGDGFGLVQLPIDALLDADIFNPPPSGALPEPLSAVLLGLGLLAFAARRRSA